LEDARSHDGVLPLLVFLHQSAVLPNDLFDAISEAELYGGVAFRHRGRCMRFGIPDSVDVRPKYELILPPKAPQKPPPKGSIKPHAAEEHDHPGGPPAEVQAA
jgi:hypothetical protein